MMCQGERTTCTLHRAVRDACVWPLLALLVLAAGVCEAEDRIQAHSLVPPILQNYWMNGMQYWAFGRETVVTDSYVKLTDGTFNSKGYLWNRLNNRMEQFELNVTVRMGERTSTWANTGHASGIGIWYVNTQRVNYLSDAAFFGFQKRFTGVGVVLDYDGTLSLIKNDGTATFDTATIDSVAVASCTVNVYRSDFFTLSLHYANNALRVYSLAHADLELGHGTANAAQECGVFNNLELSGEFHFGVTAANGQGSTASYRVHRIMLTPLLQKDRDALRDEIGRGTHIDFAHHGTAPNAST